MIFVKSFPRVSEFARILPQILYNEKSMSIMRIVKCQYSTVPQFHRNYKRPPCNSLRFSGISPNYCQWRSKYKKTSKNQEDSDEDEDDFIHDDDDDDKTGQSRIVIGHVTSLRADGILKVGLAMARNKVETCFYESRIRVNGKKIPKKSQKLFIEDEIDIIRGENQLNENLLNISRIIIVGAKEKDDSDKILVKLRRYKTLTVENYDEDPWKKG